jgi:hypothetical protein
MEALRAWCGKYVTTYGVGLENGGIGCLLHILDTQVI